MKKMRKDEATFHTNFIKWWGHNRHLLPPSFKFETKIIRLNATSFPVKELSEKEERLLLQAKHSACIQTNSDYGGAGTDCDGDVVSGGGFIIMQDFKRGNKTFYVIDIDSFIAKRDSMTRKSMTTEHFKEIGKEYELYKIYK